jgi:dynein heavy chain
MITLYLKMLKDKRDEIDQRLTSLTDGLEKLDQTNDTVLKLQKELSLMQPDLENKAKNASELLKFVESEQNKATAVQLKVSQDEADVTKRQAEVAALQMDAKRDLAKAMPAYQNAVKALESLEKKDIIEIRGFIKPPLVVQTVMEAVCILLEEQPTWESARKILNRPTYMEDLANFDKDNISAKTLAKINKYIENPDMAPESVKKVSVAAAGMCMWVHAMNVYEPRAKRAQKKRCSLPCGFFA